MRRLAIHWAILLVLGALRVAPAHAEPASVNPFLELGPLTLHGNEADMFTGGLGGFAIFDGGDRSAAAMVEYRFGRKLFFLGQAYGIVANTEGGLLGYVAAYLDLSWGAFYLTPQVAIAGYREGDSRDLGGIFQFRTSADLTWRFERGSRVGLRFGHVSNAGAQDSNPGEEELFVIYSIPFGPFL